MRDKGGQGHHSVHPCSCFSVSGEYISPPQDWFSGSRCFCVYLYVFASYCLSVVGFYNPPQSACVCVCVCVCVFHVSLSICEFACGCMSLCVSRQLFVNVCVCVYVSVWTFLYETTLCAHVCWNVSICMRFCVSMYVCVSVFAGVCE